MEGAVFAGDALADHARALIDEDRRRRRREEAEAVAARGDRGQQFGHGLSSHLYVSVVDAISALLNYCCCFPNQNPSPLLLGLFTFQKTITIFKINK